MRVRIAGVKPVHQFRYIAREIIDIAAHMATQGAHGRLIAARRAAKAEVDPPGVKGVQGAELLSYHQWRVVRQHHAAGPEMQGGGVGGEIANQHRGRCAGNADHIMVLRQPVAMIAARFGQPGEIREWVKASLAEDPCGIGARSSTENGTDLSVIKAHFATASSSD